MAWACLRDWRVGIIGLTHARIRTYNDTLVRTQPDAAETVREHARILREARVDAVVLALQGKEDAARAAATALMREPTRTGREVSVRLAHGGLAYLDISLGNYRAALDAASAARGTDVLIHLDTDPELIEAAARCGEYALAQSVCDELALRAEASGAAWGLGLLLGSRALLAPDTEAEELYRAAIEQINGTILKAEAALKLWNVEVQRQQLAYLQAISAAHDAGSSPGRTRRSISIRQKSGTVLTLTPPSMRPTLRVGGPSNGSLRDARSLAAKRSTPASTRPMR